MSVTPPAASERSGVVLVMVLVVLVVAGTLSAAVLFSAQAAVLQSDSRVRLLRRELALRSGLVAAAALLEEDARRSRVDSREEAWAQPRTIPLGEGCRVRFQLTDEEGKLHVNRLPLAEPDGRPTPQRAALERLLAQRWRLEVPERTVLPLHDLAQLVPEAERSVRAVYDAASGEALARYLTVHGPGTVNVNTAPPEVLEVALDDRHGTLAERLLRWRESEPIENLAVLRGQFGIGAEELADLERTLSATSSWFSALLVAEDDVGQSRAFAVFERTGEGVKLRSWKEL